MERIQSQNHDKARMAKYRPYSIALDLLIYSVMAMYAFCLLTQSQFITPYRVHVLPLMMLLGAVKLSLIMAELPQEKRPFPIGGMWFFIMALITAAVTYGCMILWLNLPMPVVSAVEASIVFGFLALAKSIWSPGTPWSSIMKFWKSSKDNRTTMED